LRVVDLFSSVGGLTLGVAQGAKALGFSTETSLAVDVDDDALSVYEANHAPASVINGSVTDLVEAQLFDDGDATRFAYPPILIEDQLEPLIGNVDAVIAGPPCQGNSSFNNHTRSDDPRNLLYLSVPAIAIATRAPIVIIENVPGVKRAKQSVVRKTTQLLQGSGYEVKAGYFRADAMGWPQSRKRFFLIACRGWAPLGLEEVAESLRAEPRPVSWALADFENEGGTDVMSTGATLSDENQRRVDFLHEQDIYDLPNEERPECHQNGTTYSAVYGRLRWDRPAPTITTGFLTPGRGRYVHPLERRTLVPREAARLQGFPDSFAFTGGTLSEPTRASLTKWIGDAVPVPLGYAAALAALAGRPRSS